MKNPLKAVRKSLFLKVFALSAVVSIILIYILGSTLYNRISDGIIREKVNSSVAEGTSLITYAEYRFAFSTLDPKVKISDVTKEIVQSTKIKSEETGRDIALINMNGVKKNGIDIETTSNFLQVASIPQDLRKKVRASLEVVTQRGTLSYVNGSTSAGIFVGKRITIPKSGDYEIYIAYDFRSQQQTIDLIGSAVLATGIILVLLLMITILLVLRSVIRPVQEAAKIAEDFSAGDLDQRMRVKGEDELARLGTAFNDMATTLASQIKRLENLSRVQQRFVADVSHELRTPLTTIRMASDVIHGARDSFDPTIARSAELLISQIERFELLLADLLEISRFDAEAASLAIERVDLRALITRCVEDLSYVAHEWHTSIELDLPEGELFIDGDSRRIVRILRNLVTNAIDHCESKPIYVSVRSDDTSVSIAVRDFGIGIALQQLNRVFDRFWRADPSRSRVRGGTGLGLSIAKEDAALHGGEIRVWSELGKGANFVLTLPKKYGEILQSFPISEIPTSLDVPTPQTK